MEELQRDLGRLEGKVDGVIVTLATVAADIKADRTAHEIKLEALANADDETNQRVERVEKKLYWFSGAAAAAGYLFAQFGHLLGIGGPPTSG